MLVARRATRYYVPPHALPVFRRARRAALSRSYGGSLGIAIPADLPPVWGRCRRVGVHLVGRHFTRHRARTGGNAGLGRRAADRGPELLGRRRRDCPPRRDGGPAG